MRVSEIGEFGLIELLARELGLDYPPRHDRRPQPGLIVGLGDDAAVSERRDGYLVSTTDTMVAGVHFLPEAGRWPDVGWKALAVNVSDVGAMGGRSEAALVTLGLPAEACVEDVVALYGGLREACEAFGVSLAGGDIVRSPVFFVTIAVNGWATVDAAGKPQLLTRDAAQAGDVVCVTGTLGDAAAGVRLLKEGRSSRDADRLVRAQTRPKPPVAVGPLAAAAGVRCAIDLSDGLVQDLGHVAKASGLGFRVHADRLPLSDELRRRFGNEATGLALGGGEDYELALVAPRAVLDALRSQIEVPLTEVGEAVAGTPVVSVVDAAGSPVELSRGGWDHFAPSQ